MIFACIREEMHARNQTRRARWSMCTRNECSYVTVADKPRAWRLCAPLPASPRSRPTLFLLFPSLRFSRPSHHVHRAARPHRNTGGPPPPPRRPLLPPIHPPEPLPQGPRFPHHPPVHQVILPERPVEKFTGSLARGVCSEDVVEGQDER